jgi:Domain of unknown function (DUF4342)
VADVGACTRHDNGLAVEATKHHLLGPPRRCEGNVRRIILKGEDGNTLLEVPMTAGVAAPVLTAVFAPWLVAIGAVAALVSNLTVVVARGE